MARVRIPWQGNAPLYTPYGVYEFENGISKTDIDERVIRRLQAIYGDKIEVMEDAGGSEAQESAADKDKPRKGNKGGGA